MKEKKHVPPEEDDFLEAHGGNPDDDPRAVDRNYTPDRTYREGDHKLPHRGIPGRFKVR